MFLPAGGRLSGDGLTIVMLRSVQLPHCSAHPPGLAYCCVGFRFRYEHVFSNVPLINLTSALMPHEACS